MYHFNSHDAKRNDKFKSFISVCDDGWHAYDQNCYKVHEEMATWTTARDICVKEGGMMIIPKIEEEMDFIHTIR